MQQRVTAFVLAGGRGNRLFPLTQERAKPAVPFGGKYRIVDFVLSNLINSGLYSIYVLVQFKSQSLLRLCIPKITSEVNLLGCRSSSVVKNRTESFSALRSQSR